jgi:hypothetical protein
LQKKIGVDAMRIAAAGLSVLPCSSANCKQLVYFESIDPLMYSATAGDASCNTALERASAEKP